MGGRRPTAEFAGTTQGGDRMDTRCTSQQSEMFGRLDDLAVRVRRAGLVAELVQGLSYPLLVVRLPSPVLVRVMAGRVHFWWYGRDIYPVAPLDDVAGVADHIMRRARAVGGHP